MPKRDDPKQTEPKPPALPSVMPDIDFPESRYGDEGRPRKEIDLQDAYVWGCLRASQAEMAALARCSLATIERRMAEEDFRAAYDEGREQVRMSIKRKQYTKAMQGDTAMLIFLGKVELGQREVIGFEVEDITRKAQRDRAKAEIATMTPERIALLQKALLIDNKTGDIIRD